MKKRIWLLTTALVVMAATVGGATLAFFTASAEPTQSNFVAGTLSLDGQRSGGDTVPGPMFYINDATSLKSTGVWAPGDSYTRYFQIENTGSLDARVMSLRASLDSGSQALADKLDVTVKDEYDTVVAQGKLGAFIAGDQSLMGGPIELEPSMILTLSFEVSLPLDAGNEFQGTSLVATFSAFAEQVKNNP